MDICIFIVVSFILLAEVPNFQFTNNVFGENATKLDKQYYPIKDSNLRSLKSLYVKMKLSSRLQLDRPFYPRFEPSHKVNLRFRRDFMYVASSSESIILDENQFIENTTQIVDDVKCFKNCNNAWRSNFEKRFGMKVADFYDFPFHPKLLDYTNFVAYCELADQQNKCFIDECNDQSADRIFSPSNFLCSFKRNQFVRTRPCFEETEPLTFLKCDQRCHSSAASVLKRVARNVEKDVPSNKTTTLEPNTTTAALSLITTTQQPITSPSVTSSKATSSTLSTQSLTTNSSPTTETIVVKNVTAAANIIHAETANPTSDKIPFAASRDGIDTLLKSREKSADSQARAEAGKVFMRSEMDSYERELDLLCTFQECYKKCHESIIKEICSPGLADGAIDLITSFVNWHAADVHDWHMVTQNSARLPSSCARLADSASLTTHSSVGKTPSANAAATAKLHDTFASTPATTILQNISTLT